MKRTTVYDCVKNSVGSMTPRYFAGVREKTRPTYPMYFRDEIFSQPDILTDRSIMEWQEISDENSNFIPPVICPCDDFDTIQDSESFTERWAKFPYLGIAATVDCDFTQYLGAGEFLDNAKGLGQAIEDAFNKRAVKVDKSFSYLEDLWSAQASINQIVTISGPTIKPYTIEFKRHDSLNEELTGKDQWGEKGSSNPMNALEEMQSRMFDRIGRTANRIIMNQATFDKFMESPAIKECMKAFNPSIFIPSIIASGQGSIEPEAPYNGARNVLNINRDGSVIQLWVVRAHYDFINPITGVKEKHQLLPTGKVIGYNLGSDDSSYGARFAYGAIKNMHAGINRKQKMFSRGYVPENGKNMKYEAESSPMPIIFCPDASWELNVCPSVTVETV